MPTGAFVFLAVLLLLLGFGNVLVGVFAAVSSVKCCPDGFVLGHDLDRCVAEEDVRFRVEYREFEKGLRLRSPTAELVTCFQDFNTTSTSGNVSSHTIKFTISCIDFQINGSIAHQECFNIFDTLTVHTCDSIFTFVHLYGASMMVFANIIYLLVYCPSLFLFILAPEICRRAYDKVVVIFISTQILISCIVITLGHFTLCHKLLSKIVYSLAGLLLMALTINSVLWLLIISFDVASTITQFRWAPSAGSKGRDENHKFRVYSTWVLIGTMLPVSFSTILQFSPLPDDNIFKPNFHLISKLNYKAIVHVATVPVIVAIASSVLFVYTTVKMINIQKSTSMANENRKKSVKKKYILYLQLYLLMDAPYLTGALGSSFENLWILKFCRVFQPICLLYAVLPKNTFTTVFPCCKSPRKNKNSVKPMIGRKADEIC